MLGHMALPGLKGLRPALTYSNSIVFLSQKVSSLYFLPSRGSTKSLYSAYGWVLDVLGAGSLPSAFQRSLILFFFSRLYFKLQWKISHVV